jgi:hypothetical protein
MTQVRLKCKICGKEETIEIVSPKRFDPDIEFRHGKGRQIANNKELQTDQSSSRDKMCRHTVWSMSYYHSLSISRSNDFAVVGWLDLFVPA